MRLLRIRLKNYRGTAEREIRFAHSGVTIIAGPNEAGKTSLAEAVDLSLDFLDSSTHRRVKAVKPVHADEGAEVELDVESGPYEFTLFKRFHRNKSTTLEVRRPKPESWTGREAHERVLQILAESVDMPLWRALRMQQGTELELPDLAGHVSLAAALDRAAGEARSGPEETSLFEAVEQEFRRYYTPTGQEGRELKAAAQQVEAERETVETLTRELHRADGLVTRSSRLDGEVEQYRDNVTRRESGLAQHTQRREEIRELRQQLAHLAQAAEAAAAHARNAVARVAEREELAKRVAELAEQRKSLSERANPQDDALRGVREASDAASNELGAARKAFAGADKLAHLRRADLAFRREELDHAQLSERLARVEQAEQDATRAEEEIATNTVDDRCLAEIRKAHLGAERARAAAATGTATLRAVAHRAVDLVIDESSTALGAGEQVERSVQQRLTVELTDVLRVEVRPSADAATRVERLRTAEQRLESVLGAAEVESLEEADRKHAARAAAERLREARDTVLRENLRDLSEEDLRRKVASLAVRIAAYADKRAPEPELPADFDAAQDHEEAASNARRETRIRFEEAERVHAASQQRLQELERASADAAAQLRIIESQHDALATRLAEERERCDDERVRMQAQAQQSRADAAEASAEGKRVELGQKGDEHIEDLFERAHRDLAAAREEVRRVEDERLRVSAWLEELGERGLEEELGTARSRLSRADRVHTSLRRRAEAAKLLHDTLSAQRDEARRAYVAPLRDRVEKLGRNVFGETFAVELDEDLRVVSRTLRGRTVPFDALSAGAREQISLLSRVACAMTVAEDGGVPLVLDDALGYTDPERLEGIGAVLSLAGRHGQVIVLTCAPERYASVGGAQTVRLAEADA